MCSHINRGIGKTVILAYMLAGIATAAYGDVYTITNMQGGTYEMGSDTYVLNRSMSYNMQEQFSTGNAKEAGPAVKVKEGAVATLIVPENMTFELWGTNATEESPAYPAIELPGSSTLIIKGGGSLKLHGGDGIHRKLGKNGGPAERKDETWTSTFYSGKGSAGGYGSFGNAPGIGTPGGMGGKGGSQPTAVVKHTITETDRNRASDVGFNGGSGADGGSSSDMGTLFVFGSVYVELWIGKNAYPYNSGNLSDFLPEESSGGSGFEFEQIDWHSYAGGGGGGNGGTCYSVQYAIGAGAPGAGGGGAGGSGGADDEYWHKHLDYFPGYGGQGGSGDLVNGRNGNRGRENSGHSDGGKAGKGGSAGKRGGNGKVVYSELASFSAAKGHLECPTDFNFSFNNLKPFDEANSTNLSELAYDRLVSLYGSVLNHMRGATLAGDRTPAFYQGMLLTDYPDVEIPKPQGGKTNTYFMGYYDQYGNQVFNKDGKLDIVPASESDNGAFFTDFYGNWFIGTFEDIILSPVWKDSVTVFVNHVVEDAGCADAEHRNCLSADNVNVRIISESRRYAVDSEKTSWITSSAFKNLDGEYIGDLHFDDGRIFLADNEKSEERIYLDSPVVSVTHRYMRKSYNLTWDCSDLCSADEFLTNITNADVYTKAGNVKYGRAIVYPELQPVRGKVIVGWEPAETDSMPSRDLTLKAIVEDVRFTVKDSVSRGSTECGLTLSAVEAMYGQTLTVALTMEQGTRLANFAAYTVTDASPVELTRLSDTLYSFIMPNDHVVLSGEFVLSRYSVKNVKSNMQNTHVALLDSDDGRLYADVPEFFGMTADDERYGGSLNRFEVYKSKRIDVLTMLEANEIDVEQSNSSTVSMRPNVSFTCNGSTTDEPAQMNGLVINGRMSKVFSYWAHDGSDLTVNVQWNRQLAKNISLTYPISAKITEMYSDCQNNILSQDRRKGVAFADDYVTFAVSTKDDSFDSDNIFAYCLDASQKQIPVEVDVEKDTVSNDFICRFHMPDRDVNIVISIGKKVPVRVEMPAEGYEVFAPRYAVVGSTIPFAVCIRRGSAEGGNLKMISHPTGLFNNGTMQSDGTPFGLIDTEDADRLIGTGTFVVPDDETFVIKNGLVFRPEIFDGWFTFYCDESVSWPEQIEVFNIEFDSDSKLDLIPSDTGEVPALWPVVCHIREEEPLPVSGGSMPDDTFFLPADPNVESPGYSQLSGDFFVSGNLEPAVCDSLLKKCEPGQRIYRFDFDAQAGSPCFVVAEDNCLIGAYSVFLIGQSDENIVYPVGIRAISSDDEDSAMPLFNVGGMQVPSSFSGIIIRDGKKYVVTGVNNF